MRKVWAIATREYKAAVQTKAFLISLVLMPILMFGSIFFQVMLKKSEDYSTKSYLVVDRTGQLQPALEAALEHYNKVESVDPKKGGRLSPAFALKFIEPSSAADEAMRQQRLELSSQVKSGAAEGVFEIGSKVFENTSDSRDDDMSVRFQTEKADTDDIRRWANRAINNAVQERRFSDKGISSQVVRGIQAAVPVQVKGLTKRDEVNGQIEDATDEKRVLSIVLPAILIMLMFIFIMLGSMPAMQGVVEEKQQRIAEVLLGCVTPFQLMLGKLLGVVGVALTMAAVYLGGGYAAAAYYGLTTAISPALIAWFLVFLILAVMMYGSLLMAVGAAAGDLKETQTLSTPISLMATLPMLMLSSVLRDPGSTMAVAASFFPFATPMLMVARAASPMGVPWWQLAVGVLLVTATSLACVWAAGRIFRVGLLMQGKGVKLADLARWIVAG